MYTRRGVPVPHMYTRRCVPVPYMYTRRCVLVPYMYTRSGVPGRCMYTRPAMRERCMYSGYGAGCAAVYVRLISAGCGQLMSPGSNYCPAAFRSAELQADVLFSDFGHRVLQGVRIPETNCHGDVQFHVVASPLPLPRTVYSVSILFLYTCR